MEDIPIITVDVIDQLSLSSIPTLVLKFHPLETSFPVSAIHPDTITNTTKGISPDDMPGDASVLSEGTSPNKDYGSMSGSHTAFPGIPSHQVGSDDSSSSASTRGNRDRSSYKPVDSSPNTPDSSGGNGVRGRVECTIHEGQLIKDGVRYNSIEYAFNYSESLHEGCFFLCPKAECCGCGYHPGDRERVMILRDDAGVCAYVYFNAHTPGEGMWMRWDDCHFTPEGNLIAYVSRGNHAFYPRPQTYYRIFGFNGDQCSDRGLSLETEVIETHDDYVVPKQHSITPLERFCLPFVIWCLRRGD